MQLQSHHHILNSYGGFINIQSAFHTSFPGLTESHVRVQLFHEIIIVFIPSKTEAFCLFHSWIEN